MGKGGGQGGCLRLGGHIRDVYDEKDEVEGKIFEEEVQKMNKNGSVRKR